MPCKHLPSPRCLAQRVLRSRSSRSTNTSTTALVTWTSSPSTARAPFAGGWRPRRPWTSRGSTRVPCWGDTDTSGSLIQSKSPRGTLGTSWPRASACLTPWARAREVGRGSGRRYRAPGRTQWLSSTSPPRQLPTASSGPPAAAGIRHASRRMLPSSSSRRGPSTGTIWTPYHGTGPWGQRSPTKAPRRPARPRGRRFAHGSSIAKARERSSSPAAARRAQRR
mmetsp:Transcript_7973/g.26564  ORF Transcript_7973/g.26564 Transcript_7973/m.26564 type:complete len:223 (+) Transcript_7973:633-1301(+)